MFMARRAFALCAILLRKTLRRVERLCSRFLMVLVWELVGNRYFMGHFTISLACLVGGVIFFEKNMIIAVVYI